ncbi:signal peptidase I [Methylocaldum sp.]|uniref:signal peptidase I n=1 Tax=Methylocaldum sp. TaxID=1969727 RepID=UPI002D55365B|nr:signal peptidase I [Methylocaldum sp.]HYE36540.1 signal peptidase I [Methylocaldum sp.]
MDFDFSFFLVVATLLTGIIWGGYILQRRLQASGARVPVKEPVVVEYARSFFPIILIVLLLRSFLVEPFRIPSGSMMPTLLIGDFILVNKYTYGIRLPVLNTKIVEMGGPKRGDIVVFRFPKDPKVDYIKRIIGLPGDRIAYYNKQLYVNGEAIKQTALAEYQGVGQGSVMTGARLLTEDLQGVNHDILIREGQPSVQGEFTVPEGQYFVMGDNRDNSNDSRYWGTVPESHLVGKAFFVWMSWDWENGGIAFNRLGTILN